MWRHMWAHDKWSGAVFQHLFYLMFSVRLMNVKCVMLLINSLTMRLCNSVVDGVYNLIITFFHKYLLQYMLPPFELLMIFQPLSSLTLALRLTFQPILMLTLQITLQIFVSGFGLFEWQKKQNPTSALLISTGHPECTPNQCSYDTRSTTLIQYHG